MPPLSVIYNILFWPGKLILWLDYMFPAGGMIIKSRRRRRSKFFEIANTFLFYFALWIIFSPALS